MREDPIVKRVRMVASVALASCLVLPGRAIADDARDACFTAYEQGQRLRKDGKLRAAHDQLAACTDPACAGFVRKDCSAWLDQVESSIPAVVLMPRSDAKGSRDLSVTVFVDGERIAERIDGRAIPVDPGPHDVRYELDGRSVEQRVVVPEGNKTFPLVVDLDALAPQPPSPPTAGTPPSRANPWFERLPTSTYVLGGVAMVGLASFTGFGLAGRSIQSCAPTCTRTQVSSLRSDYVVADVSLLMALAATGGAVYFGIRSTPDAPSAPAHARTSPWWLGAWLDGRGAVVDAGTSF
jgi:hypothetical protein